MAPPLVDARGYRLRHIAPGSGEGATQTLLGRTYGFTELPVGHLPSSPDLVEGSHTARLGDAGELALTFPNSAGSKGLWRERFSTDLCLEFLEVYRDDVLEQVGSIQRLEIDRGKVSVSGPDPSALLRRAYERDRAWTAAPRDVIEAYTRVPVAVLSDDFPGTSLDGSWVSTGTVSVANSQVTVTPAGSPPPFAALTRALGVTLGTDWRVTVVGRMNGPVGRISVRLITGTGGSTIHAQVFMVNDTTPGTLGMASVGGTFTTQREINPLTQPATLVLERQGRWLRAYVNGQLVGHLPVSGSAHDTLQIFGGLPSVGFVLDSVEVTELRPFLMRGSDKGDYVLPGDYPTGGLRGRYFRDNDLAGLAAADQYGRILSPDRTHYGERLDPVIDTSGGLTLPLQPGTPASYYSVRWFGSVYLRLDQGNYGFELTHGDGVRLWVGKTNFGDQIIDDWTTGSARSPSATLTASALGGEAGWYPIVLEHHQGNSGLGIALKFTPPAGGYTDPGGSAIAASTKITIPSTSLSPLGCFDNRVQGSPHFDLVYGVAQQFGYQMTCEPMQLESGEFPARLVPRVRVGRDTDRVLEPEETDDVEPAISPGLTLDSSDQAVTLRGSGAGLPDAAGSQVTVEITDIARAPDALFLLQTQVDAGDVAFADLLAARLNAELALRATPWEEVRATPRAQEELADTWPLSEALSAMRWRPGDGVRLRVPDISVEDLEPRQMVQVTRAFAAEGRTGTQVSFRQRPRSAARSVRGLLQAAISPQRSYQGQIVTIAGGYVLGGVAAGAFSGYSIVPLLAGDRIVRAVVRVVTNSAGIAIGVEINGTDRTTALGGGWSTVPLEIEVSAYATQASSTDNRLYARLQNNGGSLSGLEHQLIVEVLR